MLLPAPPQIVIFGFPPSRRDPDKVGCVTIIGIGAITLTMAATPTALALEVGEPSSRIKLVSRVRVIVTRSRFTGSLEERVVGSTPTEPALGKSKATTSLAVWPKPLLRA
jgi:hypothetical protein